MPARCAAATRSRISGSSTKCCRSARVCWRQRRSMIIAITALPNLSYTWLRSETILASTSGSSGAAVVYPTVGALAASATEAALTVPGAALLIAALSLASLTAVLAQGLLRWNGTRRPECAQSAAIDRSGQIAVMAWSATERLV